MPEGLLRSRARIGPAILCALVVALSAPIPRADEPELGSDDDWLELLPSVPGSVGPRGTVLPRIAVSKKNRPLAGEPIRVESFRFTGNTVFRSGELDRLAEPLTGRDVSFTELAALRDAITLLYIRAGYISSGAVIPSQTFEDGVVEVQITEGVLGALQLTSNRAGGGRQVEDRVRRAAAGAVNVNDLRRELEALQRDPRIRGIRAALVPGDRRGEADLLLEVDEATPYQLSVEFNNYRSPTVGAETGTIRGAAYNLTGRGDVLYGAYAFSEGYAGIDGLYEIPITRWGTKLGFAVSTNWSEVVDDDFDQLDIDSRYVSYGITLRQPIYVSPHTSFDVYLTGEHRRSKCFFASTTCLLPGSDDGVTKVTPIRLGANLVFHDAKQIASLRSEFSQGIDALRASDNSGPDGTFFAWYGRFQYVRRFGFLNASLHLRTAAQLTDSSLLGLERVGLGGHDTVRGYRENRLVRDNAVVSGIELQVPVLWRRGVPLLELGPLFDIGWGWNKEELPGEERRLRSVGIVGRVTVNDRMQLSFSWAKDLKRLDTPGEHDLQDSGFQFQVRVQVAEW